MPILDQLSTGIRSFNVGEYHRMGRAGIFADNERTELIEGAVYSMPPAGPPHAAVVHFIFKYFLALLDAQVADVRVEQPLSIDEYNEPLPDVMIVRPDWRGYFDAHPTPGDVFVIIEVADSSLDRDLRTKSKLYARAGIREYWVVDVNERQVHIFNRPSAEGYGEEQVLDDKGTMTLGSVSIEIARFFAP
ncbi:Uma2 family endonuclease [Gloeobacter morelensis]|uniref:Uma2 family endonuclease n=1 Tax=Gloeobacter morelensis MG652769 TaxID=2781736 RepID=A0ABY3PGH0_9CYAN|nr:Uma2 family endonuclease [Gloeobacter morelensis]UFP92758.1 Uma2 family endonuclease [Gloeobacter morelensis MG652769]